jgi:hypothetical protein
MTAQECYLLPSEDAAEFEELQRSLEQTHLPANPHERILVEEFAQSAWELRRVRRIDRDFWEYIGGHYNRAEAGIAEALAQEKESKFRTHLRLRAQVERSYYRALAAVERMHRDRDRVSNQAVRRTRTTDDIPVTAAASHADLQLVTPEPAAPVPASSTEIKALARHPTPGAITHEGCSVSRDRRYPAGRRSRAEIEGFDGRDRSSDLQRNLRHGPAHGARHHARDETGDIVGHEGVGVVEDTGRAFGT